MRAPCEGQGEKSTDVQYGTVICPVCHAIAQDDEGQVAAHTVLVIGHDWDDDDA